MRDSSEKTALLAVEELPQCGFLVRTSLKQQQYPSYRLRIGHCALVKFRSRQWMNVSLKRDEILFIHGLRNAGRNVRRLRSRRGQW